MDPIRWTMLILLLAAATVAAGCLGATSSDDDLDAQSNDDVPPDTAGNATAPVCEQAGEVLWEMDLVAAGSDGTGPRSGTWGDTPDDLTSPCALHLEATITGSGFWELQVEAPNGTTMGGSGQAVLSSSVMDRTSDDPVPAGPVDATFTYTGAVDVEATLTAR